MDLLPIVVAVVFVALSGAVAVRARRTSHVALWRLSAFLLTIGVVASAVPLLSQGTGVVPLVILLAGLALYPVALLWFGDSLVAGRSRLGRATVAVLVIEVVVMTVASAVESPADALRTDLYTAGGLALLAHLLVDVVLRRERGMLASGYVRRRAGALRAGLALLAGSLAAGLYLPSDGDRAVVVAFAGAALAGVVLRAAVAPPRWLQAVFVLPDHDVLMAAEHAMVRAPDTEAALRELLLACQHLLDGEGAWLEHRGAVLARVGELPAEPHTSPSAPADDRVATRAVAADATGAATWLLSVVSGETRLVVATRRDPLLYGLDVSDLLPRTVRRAAITLVAREGEANRLALEQAEQETAHFRQVAELKEDLLATINHELRTPLALVTGGLDLVDVRWDDLDEDRRRLLVGRSRAHAADLQATVLQVLALVELRSGDTPVRPRPVDTHEVLDRASRGLPELERLEGTACGALATVDPDLSVRILRELVDNALRHTDGPVRVEVAADTTNLHCTVADHGAGLAEDLAAAFGRGGNYLHRETRGLGLGLSLATETAELLGGRVEVDTGPRGTTVTCRLPIGAPVLAA